MSRQDDLRIDESDLDPPTRCALARSARVTSTARRPMSSKIFAMCQLCRPLNGLIVLVGVALGAHLGVRGQATGWTSEDAWSTVAVGIATGLILSAGNAVNDVCDVEIDRVNRPERPLPSGRLTRRLSLFLAGALLVIGIGLATWVSRSAVLIAVGAALLLVLYAIRLKRVPIAGNLTVALLSAGAIAAGGVAVVGVTHTLVPVVLVFLFSAVREVVKDVEDLHGDTHFGAETAAVRWGPRTAAMLASGFAVLGIAASVFPFIAEWPGYGWRYILTVLLGVDAIVAATMCWFVLCPEERVARSAQRLIKLGMVLGLLAVFVG